MKKIVCTFNLFDLHQQIYLVDGNDMRVVAISILDDLGDDVAMMCDKYNVNDVQLFGSKSYAEKISKRIKEVTHLRYYDRPIRVEVN